MILMTFRNLSILPNHVNLVILRNLAILTILVDESGHFVESGDSSEPGNSGDFGDSSEYG